MKLLTSDFPSALVNDNIRELYVCLDGPKDSPYEGGMWKIHVEIPDQYPYKSPSIGFETKIFHPNIDEHSGSVCLDVINQTWSPMFTMCHIFETFIPQLLNYPNAADPLNGDASSLYLNDRKGYDEKVKYYVHKYANKGEILQKFKEENGLDSDDDDDQMSDDTDNEEDLDNIAISRTSRENDVVDDIGEVVSEDEISMDEEEEEEENDEMELDL